MAFPFLDLVIIVGAGVFRLSTALAIERRYPDTKITVIDRGTPPVADGTSVDTSRIIRPDYVDPLYAKLALRARAMMESDPALQPYYFKRGFTFCIDGQPGDFESLWAAMLANLKREPPHMWNELTTHDAVFAHLNGNNGDKPVPETQLGRARKRVKGFTNKKCAAVDAEAIVKVYYERCRSKPSAIDFVLGTAVDRLLYSSSSSSSPSTAVVQGVVLEDGRELRAHTTILATGGVVRPPRRLLAGRDGRRRGRSGVAYIRTAGVAGRARTRSTTPTSRVPTPTSPPPASTYVFTPDVGGLLKVCCGARGRRRCRGRIPQMAVRPSIARRTRGRRWMRAAEAGIRDELREMAPRFAERPFARTKYCWAEQTSDAGEFLICPHPRYGGLRMATGGSLHGWKFLPLLGEFVVDSMTPGGLDGELVRLKWSWESKIGAEMGKFGFMRKGQPRELRDVVSETE